MATERSHRGRGPPDRLQHVDDDAHPSAGPSTSAVGEGEAWTVLAYLITGPLLYGGLGWLADRWLGTTPWLAVVGIVGGTALAVYIVWVRYGAHDRRPHP